MQTGNKLFASLAGAALSVSVGENQVGALEGELARVPQNLLDEWALCASSSVRDTIARALARVFYCLGVAAAQFSSDPTADVRATAVDAAAARHPENPVHYRELLHQRSSDKNRRVRRAARRAEIALS